MEKIYIVDDDENIHEAVMYSLRAAGYESTGFVCGKSFYATVTDEMPDLVLLDIMLPGEDGLTILKNLRGANKTKSLPVIITTAKNTEIAKVKALDLGADDYITKPFSVMELISRIGAVLRRSRVPMQHNLEQLEYGDILVDNTRRTVFVNSETIALTYKEYELLHFMMLKKELAIERDKIMQAVWGYGIERESKTLDVHIRSLRQKLGPASGYIKTIRNVGYKIGD